MSYGLRQEGLHRVPDSATGGSGGICRRKHPTSRILGIPRGNRDGYGRASRPTDSQNLQGRCRRTHRQLRSGGRESPGDASHLAAPAPIRSAEGLFRGPGCGVAGEIRGKLIKESEQFFSLNPRKQSKTQGLHSKLGRVTVKVTHTLHLSMALGRDGTSPRDDGRVAPSLRANREIASPTSSEALVSNSRFRTRLPRPLRRMSAPGRSNRRSR